jgi:hypothetical protein
MEYAELRYKENRRDPNRTYTSFSVIFSLLAAAVGRSFLGLPRQRATFGEGGESGFIDEILLAPMRFLFLAMFCSSATA